MTAEICVQILVVSGVVPVSVSSKCSVIYFDVVVLFRGRQ